MATCQCGEPSTHACANCNAGVCDDINCGIDTVDGYLCGTYTHWGCSKKYTTCDECCDDKAIHEENFIHCVDCYMMMCDQCAVGEFTTCPECENDVCEGCLKDHECDGVEDEAEAEAEDEAEEAEEEGDAA
jgi:hypothetical protein